MLCEFDPSKTVRKYLFSYTVTVYIHVVLINHERSPSFPATPIYIYISSFSFCIDLSNLLNVRVRYFHYIWSKKRRTVLLLTVKYKITTKSRLYVDILMFLAMGVIRIKATPLRHFCNISDFSGFGFVFCFFVLLSVRICFVLMCWCLKRRGGGGEISPLYFLYIVVKFWQRKRKSSFILHMRTDRNWYLIYAHSRVFRMRYDDLVSIFSSAD